MGLEQCGNFSDMEALSLEKSELPVFEDSDRMEGMDLPAECEGFNGDREFYPDSGRESSDGPQWNEGEIIKIEELSDLSKSEVPVAFETGSAESQCDVNDNNLDVSSEENEQQYDSGEKTCLTDEEKAIIKKETGWSDEIIEHIENMDQYEIYKNAGLHEEKINGRTCLIKDINLDYVDPKTGMTNRELMAKGRSPIDEKTGEKIELHHMGQDFDAPFAELCENSEHGDGNHSTLHTKNSDSWRNDPEQKNQYQREKKEHWQSRANEGGES